MAKLTPEEAQEKHARRLVASIDDARKGIEAVTEAPGKAAAAAQDKMLRNLTASITSGKWAANVGAVTLEKWKSDMINKGLGRIPAGIEAAKDKSIAFYAKLFPYQDRIKGTLSTMPDLTLEDSINRMVKWTREMAKFTNK